MRYVVLAHGGAGSFDAKEHDGPDAAAQAGLAALKAGGSPLDAVLVATRLLEDNPRFNAGTGSNLRLDGSTVEMDASVATSDGRFGAVAAIERVKNPVAVAADVLTTPHDVLVGAGATAFARRRGHADHDPVTPQSRAKFEKVLAMMRAGGFDPGWGEWEIKDLEAHWNFDTPLRDVLGPSDTVGAVATDGVTYAAALSTGGTAATLRGRVGDVPLPGCGLTAGAHGAVCVTGDGEHLARARLADRVYGWLADGVTPEQAVARACASFNEDVAVGLLVVDATGAAGGSNLAMAWAAAEESA